MSIIAPEKPHFRAMQNCRILPRTENFMSDTPASPTEPFYRIIKTKDEAQALLERYFVHGDDSVFAPMIRGMMTAGDEDTLAIMRGSGNELSIFEVALYLLQQNKLLTQQESFDLLDRDHAMLKAKAAA
jgi:hypothetical protein